MNFKSRFHLRADLTPGRNQLLEYAYNVSRTQRDPDARSSIDFACADRNCSLMFRTADGTIKHFSSYDEFDNLLSSITSSRETEEAYSNKWQPFDDSVSKWFGAASPSDSQSDSRSVSSNISATKPLNMAWLDGTKRVCLRGVDLHSWMKNPSNVFIGRSGPTLGWGNPFKITDLLPRTESIKRYRDYLINNPLLLNRLDELKGKRLGCVCRLEESCHGDVLLSMI